MTSTTEMPSANAAANPPGTSRWIDIFQCCPATFMLPAVDRASPYASDDLVAQCGPVPDASGAVLLRINVGLPVAGKPIRVRFSNEVGAKLLHIRSAALCGESDAGPAAMTFGGTATIRIPPHAPAVSDPVVTPPDTAGIVTIRVEVEELALTPMIVQRGAATMTLHDGDEARDIMGRPLVSGIELLTDEAPRVIVAMGDSLIDANGAGCTTWAGLLRDRFAEPVVILNAGISGNRVVADGWGQSMVGRLDRDALRFADATHVLLSGGLNDVGMAGASPVFAAQPNLRTEDLLAGYRQIGQRVRARGKKLVMATLPPIAGSFFFSPEKEAQRQEVNAWIRRREHIDGILDIDAALRDDGEPASIRAEFDAGDKLHPNAAGHEAIARAFDPAMVG